MISPAEDPRAKKTCRTCTYNRGDRWCLRYVDEVTGDAADLHASRNACKGDKWESAAWRNIDTAPSVTYPITTDDAGIEKIETPKATIYKDPPSKLYE